ncbi:MAG TPA: protein kinase, partial [Kofleriaceae bacterium]
CTPAYAAPEQLRGTEIDHRVDLYGLGATLFEMLSGGYLPFEGDLDTTVRAKLTLDAPSILTRAPNVPPGLVTIVSKLLAYDPQDRPRSARAVIRALETSLTLPRPPIRTIEMRPIAKRRTARRLKLKGAALGIALCVLAVIVHRDDQSIVRPHVAEAAAAEAPPSDVTWISSIATVVQDLQRTLGR